MVNLYEVRKLTLKTGKILGEFIIHDNLEVIPKMEKPKSLEKRDWIIGCW